MSADEVRAVDVREWLRLATEDLRRVEILLTAIPPDIAGALFHSQQAAEKAIKGFLTWHDIAFRRVHELGEIGTQALQIDPSLAELVQRADSLTRYAVHFRYPGAPYQPELPEAHSASKLAREVVEAVLSRLPNEARP